MLDQVLAFAHVEPTTNKPFDGAIAGTIGQHPVIDRECFTGGKAEQTILEFGLARGHHLQKALMVFNGLGRIE
ncbi:hypothetical protein D3C76_1452260 [compost metagenome]